MKVFYGGIFVERETLLQAGIEHPIKLEYYKMINQNKQNIDNKIYGIDIVKTEYRDNNAIVEEKELKYLSKDENEIDKMLNLLKKHIVTPTTMQDVIEDLQKQGL